MTKYSIAFQLTRFKAEKQNPDEPHKEVNSKLGMWFVWAVVVRVLVLVLISKGT